METSFAFVERVSKDLEAFAMVFGGKGGQVAVEDLDDEFGMLVALRFFFSGFSMRRGTQSNGLMNSLGSKTPF